MKQELIRPGSLTRREWAKRLNDQWDNIRETAVEGFLRLGNELRAAKTDLEKHGKRRQGGGYWYEFVERDLKFSIQIAQMLMRIAMKMENILINDKDVPKLLPPDQYTIDQICRLDDDTRERLIEDGTINPSIQRNAIARILRAERVAADEARIMSLRPRPGKYRTIVVDPAWEYDWLSLAGRAKPGYAMQNLADLHEINLRQWAEDQCELYCWATNNFMYEAHKLVEHWGWQHRTVLTWVKPPPFGLGSYFRNSTEHVIYATFGKITTRPAAASISTHFEAPRGEHSEKPEKFYEIVRAASYPPYGEGNQRLARPDFISLFETIALKAPIVEAAE
jgi:N6-adenosine-specific RNA methylase IME4